MGLTSARRVIHLCDHVSTMLTTLLGACHQASFFLGRENFSDATRMLHERLAADVPVYRDDVPLMAVFDRIRGFLAGAEFAALLERHVPLGPGVRARALGGTRRRAAAGGPASKDAGALLFQ